MATAKNTAAKKAAAEKQPATTATAAATETAAERAAPPDHGIDKPHWTHKGLHQAKLAVMRDVDYIQKTKSKDISYTFLSEEEIVKHIQQAFVAHGLTVCPIGGEPVKIGSYTTGRGATMNHMIVSLRFRLTHADSGESEEGFGFGEGADIGDKALNKASTGAYKYFLRQAFLIPSGNDPDMDDTGKTHPRGPEQAPRQGGASAPKQQSKEQPEAGPPAQGGGNGKQQPPAEKKPVQPASEESFAKCLDAIRGALGLALLERYRGIYKDGSRGYSPDQLARLDAAYEERKKTLTAGDPNQTGANPG